MPNYDFVCMNCDTTTEVYLSFDSNDRPICEKCGEFMNKVFSATPAHFKGGGWGAS